MELKRYADPEHGTWGYPHYAPLSFERPEPFCDVDFSESITDPIEGRQACHLAPAEWRLLGWLERERFDYDYYAETQLHDGTLNLLDYRVLIIAVHPEYWSLQMYQQVKHWVQHTGGKLMYLGGNGLNCEVQLQDAAMTVHNGSIQSLWNSGMNGCDSRFGMRHESEASLLGVVFTPAGAMTGAPIESKMRRTGYLPAPASVTDNCSVKNACTDAAQAEPPDMKPTNARPAHHHRPGCWPAAPIRMMAEPKWCCWKQTRAVLSSRSAPSTTWHHCPWIRRSQGLQPMFSDNSSMNPVQQ